MKGANMDKTLLNLVFHWDVLCTFIFSQLSYNLMVNIYVNTKYLKNYIFIEKKNN